MPPAISRTVPLVGGIQVIAVAAGIVASVTHRGSYEPMGTLYAAIAAWIQQRGHRVVGPA
jgi:effector-binding domain-containing protein